MPDTGHEVFPAHITVLPAPFKLALAEKAPALSSHPPTPRQTFLVRPVFLSFRFPPDRAYPF